jgi:TRAP-type C4-dicarboxylate transport system substrate-binding protein
MLLRSLKIASVGLAIASCSATLQAKELVFNSFFPPSHFIYPVITKWTEDVAAATDGRVTFEIPSGSLASPPQQLSMVKAGTADLAIMANIFVQKQVPTLNFSSLPFLVNDAEAASVSSWKTYEKFLAEKQPFKRQGVELLSVFNFSGGYLYGLEEEPIQTLEELKSKRLWALPGYSAENLKNLDISPVTGPAVKIGEVVSKGVVDAYYGITVETVTDFKAAPYTKNVVLFPFGSTSTSFSLFINNRTWSRISDTDKAIITKLSGEAFARKVGIAAKEASSVALTQMELAGTKVVASSPELYSDLKKAAEPLFTSFIQSANDSEVDGRAMLDYFKAEYDKEINQ